MSTGVQSPPWAGGRSASVDAVIPERAGNSLPDAAKANERIGEAQRRVEAEFWREFEIARPTILGAMLDALAHGLRSLMGPSWRPRGLPRMADFGHWISACEPALWPVGTFARAYAANRRAAIESVIDGDPVASRVRDIMAQQQTWTGTAAELLCFSAEATADGSPASGNGWPKNPRSLAGRLRRAQPGLRSLGIDIVFSREGRAGSRTITMRRRVEYTAYTVSSSSGNGAMRSPQP